MSERTVGKTFDNIFAEHKKNTKGSNLKIASVLHPMWTGVQQILYQFCYKNMGRKCVGKRVAKYGRQCYQHSGRAWAIWERAGE